MTKTLLLKPKCLLLLLLRYHFQMLFLKKPFQYLMEQDGILKEDGNHTKLSQKPIRSSSNSQCMLKRAVMSLNLILPVQEFHLKETGIKIAERPISMLTGSFIAL